MLLRSLGNMIAFSLLWYGLISNVSFAGIPLWIPGTLLTLLCIVGNIVMPCIAVRKIKNKQKTSTVTTQKS